MNMTELDEKSATLEAVRVSWEALILPSLRGRVADSSAHASRALTHTLKVSPDGRASIQVLNRSPSLLAANMRLDDLWYWLVGASERSLHGKIRDAREAIYAAAAVLYFPLVPEEYRSRSTPVATRAQINLVRAAAIHGFDPRKSLEGEILDAKRTLKAALEQAGRRSTLDAQSEDALETWEQRCKTKLANVVHTLLVDSHEYCDRQALVDLVHPDHIGSMNQ